MAEPNEATTPSSKRKHVVKDTPAGYFRDQRGNVRTPIETEVKDGKLLISYQYIFEPGTITLRGAYPKLQQGVRCVHPERLDCNGGEGYPRCEFMKYGGSLGNWKCTAETKGS